MPWPMRYISEHLPVVLRTSPSASFPHTLHPGDCLWRWRKVVVQGEDEEDDHSWLASQRRVCGGKVTSIVIIPAILWKDPWWSLMIPNLWLSNQLVNNVNDGPGVGCYVFGFFVGKWSTRPSIEMSSTHMSDSKWSSYEASPGQVRQL